MYIKCLTWGVDFTVLLQIAIPIIKAPKIYKHNSRITLCSNANNHDSYQTDIKEYEEFRRKTGYLHFCQFERLTIEAAEI